MVRQSLNSEIQQSLNDPEFIAALMLTDLGEKIADALKVAREVKGLNQKELADLLGTKQPRISQMEDPAYCNYTLTTLTLAAAYLDCELDVVLRPTDRKTAMNFNAANNVFQLRPAIRKAA